MLSRTRIALLTPLCIACLAGPVGAHTAAAPAADEGMWLPNRPPLQTLKSRYGFEPTAPWLEHMQKSAVRFNSGGSGSIVSADGLVMTNHHVAVDALQAISTPQNDLVAKGFQARSREEELKCPDLELNVLWAITDVTARVNAAVPAGAPIAEAGLARREAIASIEKEAQESSGLQSQVVTLYQGGQYHLYQYRRYTDVRLVFAPEEAIAFFGGDTDNFEYPRFDLDVTFFRIYVDGKPLKAEHSLRWSAGAKEDELALVFGHPGSTNRGYTADHLKSLRDVETPRRLARLRRAEVTTQVFAGRSAEYRRIAGEDLANIANGRKAVTGTMAGLADPAVIAAKEADEQNLRSEIARRLSPEQSAGALAAFDAIARSRATVRELGPRSTVLEGLFRASEYARFARTIVQLGAELPKPSAQRLREYGDARLPSLYQDLYSPAPIYDEYETYKLEQALLLAVETLGGDDPLTLALLAGKSPAARAEELVKGTTLKAPDARRGLVEGGAAGLAEAIRKDPLLALGAQIDPEVRSLRKRSEDEVESVERDSYAKIAAARFAIQGEGVYPDATFTLRMAFGPIKGYEDHGQRAPAFTTIAGAFPRFEERKGQEGFELPASWLGARDRLKLDTPFNFVCTADIIGGNSGSPVVNKAGEVIGLIFDMNLQSLAAGIRYANDGAGRAVAVDSRAIVEALEAVYHDEALVRELTGR